MPQQESRDFSSGSTRLRTPESISTWSSWRTRCPGKKLCVGQKARRTEALGAWAHSTLTWVSNLRMGSSLPEKPENWGQEQRAHSSTGPPTCETVGFQLHLQPWAAVRSNDSKPLWGDCWELLVGLTLQGTGFLTPQGKGGCSRDGELHYMLDQVKIAACSA